MMIQAETWRTALLLMKCYGPAASAQAAIRAAENPARGDAGRCVAWQRVVDAIVVLQSERPPNGETVH
jgi:hypothetical protein